MDISVIVTENPFNSLFARSLRIPLLGSDYNVTDGHGAYNDYPDHVRCLFHKANNEAKKDKILSWKSQLCRRNQGIPKE